MKLWESLIPKVTATVYMEDYGRPMPRRAPYPASYVFMPPPQSDIAFVLARGQFMKPGWDTPYWEPNDLKKPPRWRDRTHHAIELVHGLVQDEIVESAYVYGNHLTALTGDRQAADREERTEVLCDRVGQTAMTMLWRLGGMDVVGYEIVEAPGMTDPRRFIGFVD